MSRNVDTSTALNLLKPNSTEISKLCKQALVKNLARYNLLADEIPHDPTVLKACAMFTNETTVQRSLVAARILSNLTTDSYAVAAGIVYDAFLQQQLSPAAIYDNLGFEVYQLLANCRRMENILEKQAPNEHLMREVLSTTADRRVFLIKLSRHLCALSEMGCENQETQRLICDISSNVYAPIAKCLGLNVNINQALEDIAFKFSNPRAYYKVSALIRQSLHSRRAYLDSFKLKLENLLENQGIRAEVSARAKHIYSIWSKMTNKTRVFKSIHDVHAVRVITASEKDCYRLLSLVHRRWQIDSGGVTDYISNPKANGYKSIHVDLLGPRQQPLELQIRTKRMHDELESGAAAHWRYKCRAKLSIENINLMQRAIGANLQDA